MVEKQRSNRKGGIKILPRQLNPEREPVGEDTERNIIYTVNESGNE